MKLEGLDPNFQSSSVVTFAISFTTLRNYKELTCCMPRMSNTSFPCTLVPSTNSSRLIASWYNPNVLMVPISYVMTKKPNLFFDLPFSASQTLEKYGYAIFVQSLTFQVQAFLSILLNPLGDPSLGKASSQQRVHNQGSPALSQLYGS